MRLPGQALRLSRLRGANNEGLLLGVILVVLIAMYLIDRSALTLTMAGDILRGAVDNMGLALGVLLVIICCGIDVSFAAIAMFCGYATTVFVINHDLHNGLWPLLAAAVLGAALGSVNAVLVAGFKLQTLIATLGTQSIIWGSQLALIGSTYRPVLPSGLAELGRSTLFYLGTSPVNTLVLPIAVIALLVGLTLRFTMFGRSMYAIGGGAESAKRAGISVVRVQAAVFVIAGALAGFAGMVHVSLVQHASPFELVGTELGVIAAVVIGGASDAGGRGSVQGTVLGVVLLSLVDNSLVRLGVPSFWHEAVSGAIILAGVALQARGRRLRQKPSPILDEVAAA